jgi:hypothetical protein
LPHLVDTDILVDYQRRNAEALNYLAELGDWSYSVATEMELVAGARNRDEIAAIVHTLYPYRKLPLTPETGELASNIMKEYSGSRGMDPLDAIIAASALSEGPYTFHAQQQALLWNSGSRDRGAGLRRPWVTVIGLSQRDGGRTRRSSAVRSSLIRGMFFPRGDTGP